MCGMRAHSSVAPQHAQTCTRFSRAVISKGRVLSSHCSVILRSMQNYNAASSLIRFNKSASPASTAVHAGLLLRMATQECLASDIPSKRYQRNNSHIGKGHAIDKQAAGNQERASAPQSHGKENHTSNQNSSDQLEQKFCFECNRSLAKSRHLINIAGQMHKWHPECFRCTVCNNLLESESSCHVYKDKIFCRSDYAKLQRDNSTKCARCRWPIAASDWVRKAGKYVYHLACFTCDTCLRQLSTGEQFTIDIQDKEHVRLLCRLHFAVDQYQQPERSLQSHLPASVAGSAGAIINEASFTSRLTNSPPDHLSHNQFEESAISQNQQALKGFQQTSTFNRDQYLHLLATASCNTNNMPSNADCQKQTPSELQFNNTGDLLGNRSNCQLQLDNELLGSQHQVLSRRSGPISSSSSSNGSSTTGRLIGAGHPSKSKRVRTTFTEEQLHILQDQFQRDSNPDGQDLERIATITGLSKRVTQVWFQNSRARQKKYMIKRKPASLNSSSGAHNLAASGSSSLQTNHLFVQSTHQMLVERPSAAVGATNKENYQSGSRVDREKSWPANLSDRSELSLDEQVASDDLDDGSSLISNDHRDEEVENETNVSGEDEEDAVD